jgi:predicted DNA-binding protein with PD1-like motif
LQRNEPVVATLTALCEREGIHAAVFLGIGAVKNTELGYYSLEKREYYFKTISEDREVASMTGNVTLVDGKPFIHLHAVLSACDESLACVGGHIKECEVAVTLEIFLTPLATQIERAYNEDIGLKLLKL